MPFPAQLTDHPRRCTWIRKDGSRCKNWGLVDAKNCKYHNGVQQQRRSQKCNLRNIPVFYRKHISESLGKAISEQIGLDPDEQVQLYEELALIRHVASNFVKLYGAAVETGDQNTICMAGAGMVEALNNVEAICSAAAKIQQKQRDRFSIHDLKYVVNKLTRMLYDVCGDEHQDIAERFKLMVDEKLALPTGYQQGTDLQPDETVLEIDSSVPFVDEEE